MLCIDVRVQSARQLFDSRDPAPFPQRDLDEHAVEYLMSCAAELPRKQPFKMVFWISEPLAAPFDALVVERSVRAYFEYERDRLERAIRLQLRRGQQLFWIGVAVLVACLTGAELLRSDDQQPLARLANHGLEIMGWVAMWRPLEALMYDWWPLLRRRETALRLLVAKVEVLVAHDTALGAPPDVHSSTLGQLAI